MREIVEACARLERAKTEYLAAAAAVRALVRKESVLAMQAASDRLTTVHSAQVYCVIEVVAEYHDITERELLGPRRPIRFTVPRQRAMVIIRDLLHLSLSSIGKAFKRDHGTVIWAIKQVQARCEVEPSYKADMAHLRVKCHEAVAQLKAA